MDHFQSLKNSILDLIADFQSNPFDFLYEADIQAVLFALARSRFSTEKVEMMGGYHKSEHYPDGKVARVDTVLKALMQARTSDRTVGRISTRRRRGEGVCAWRRRQ